MRLYLLPSEVSEMPLGLAPQVQQLLSQLNTGVLEKLIARASVRCDAFCSKRLQAPGSTTLSANASAGSTTLSVASTLTLDNLDEQVAIIGIGGSQETIPILSGGVAVTSYTSPYPGTITLAAPTTYSHSSNDPVKFAYQEVSEAQSTASADPYSEALLLEQQSQIAIAHLPSLKVPLTRDVFLRCYPIITILSIEHSYSYNNQYYSIDPTTVSLQPTNGIYRFRLATVVFPFGNVRTTYTGGFTVVPDDVKLATSYYLADELVRFINPFNVIDESLGKRRVMYKQGGKVSENVEMAEVLLEDYRRLT